MKTKNEVAKLAPSTAERSRPRLITGVRAGGLVDDIEWPFGPRLPVAPVDPGVNG